MKKHVLILLVLMFIVYGGFSQAPSHESKIIMLGNTNETLYSLDSNGLLRTYNKASKQIAFNIPIRTTISLAIFHYPYIVLVDTKSIMHVYEITSQFIVYSAPFLLEPKGNIAFSKDNSIFAFTGTESVFVMNTQSWTELNSFLYLRSTPKFLYLSQKQNNLMNINYDGAIEYRNIIDGSVFKIEQSEVSINAPILNNNLRYSIGYDKNTIYSIDILNGDLIHSLTLSDDIKNIFLHEHDTKSSNTTTTINVLGTNTTSSSKIYNISIDNEGVISQNDLLTIQLSQEVSYIASDSAYLFVGFTNGEVWNYSISNNSQDHEILIQDNTYAIYDAIHFQNTLAMSTKEGIITLPTQALFSNTRTRLPRSAAIEKKQSLQYPSFISNFDNSNNSNSLLLLSSNMPFTHLIPNISSAQKHSVENVSPSQTTPLSLLFSVSLDSFQLSNPKKIAPNTTYLLNDTQLRIEYSEPNSKLKIIFNNKETQYPIFTSRFIFDLIPLEDENILWTNSQISSNEKFNSLSSNTIYSYTVKENITAKFPPLALPFIKNEIYYFRVLDLPHILIIESQPHLNMSSILLVKIPDEFNEETTLIYPTKVQNLSYAPYTQILKIIPLGKEKDKILIFTEDYISLLQIDTNKSQLLYEHKTLYPTSFGILLNAQVSPLTKDSNEFAITIIDTNNSVAIITIDENIGFTHKKSFNILTNNTLQYHE